MTNKEERKPTASENKIYRITEASNIVQLSTKIQISNSTLDLNSGNRYYGAFELLYIPDEGEDLSKIPSQIRVQLIAEGLGSNFVNLNPSDTIIKLPQGDELRNEFTLRQYFNVHANAATLLEIFHSLEYI